MFNPNGINFPRQWFFFLSIPLRKFLCFSTQPKLIFNFLFAAQVSHYKQTSMAKFIPPWHECHFILSGQTKHSQNQTDWGKQTNIRWSLKVRSTFCLDNARVIFLLFFQPPLSSGKIAFLFGPTKWRLEVGKCVLSRY